MKYDKVNAIANCFIALSSFLGILFALIYYYFQIKGITIIEGIIVAIVYIDFNLSFLYYLKKRKII